jgi:DNA-directed RNA polymerase subunit N (RpoN/RPB10)
VKKIAQIVTQPILLSKLIRCFYCGKSSSKVWSTFEIFEKVPKRKQSPIGRKFGQSGHPAYLERAVSGKGDVIVAARNALDVRHRAHLPLAVCSIKLK